MAPSAPSAEVITYPTNYSSRATLKYEKLATYPAAPGFADGGLYLATAYLFSDSDSAECNVWAQQQQQQQGGYAIFQSPGTPCAVCSVINFTLCHDLNPYPADSWSGSGMTQNFVNTPYSHVGPPIGPSTNLSVIAHCGVNTCTNKYATYADAVQSLSCGGVLVTNENKTLYISHDQHPGITAVKFCGNCPWAGGWFSGPVSNQHSSGSQLTGNLNLPAPGSYAVSISKGGKTLTLNVKGIKLEFANNDPLNLPWTQGGSYNMNNALSPSTYSPGGLTWSGGASNNGVLYFGSNGASYNVHVVASNLPSCYGDKTVNVLKVEIKKPAGDPTTEPNAYNERTYNSANPGVATVVCEAEDTPNADKLRWTIEDVGEIQATWEPHVDGNTHIGKGLNPTATFSGLPAQYTGFGSKTITLTMDEPGITSSDTQEVEIFFPRSAINHSFINPSDPKQAGPNWYYYSLQILPCVADNWGYIDDAGISPAWKPMYNYTQGWIILTPDRCPGNPFYYIAHESKHHTDFFQEIWQGTGYESIEDEDEDGIRDDFEIDHYSNLDKTFDYIMQEDWSESRADSAGNAASGDTSNWNKYWCDPGTQKGYQP